MDWWIGGWLGWQGVFEKWTLLRSAYAKAAARRAEDGRTPVGGRFRGVSILVEANRSVVGQDE